MKILIEIQGNLYDLWELRSLERNERWNDKKGEMEYLLILNRRGIGTNFAEVEFTFDTQEDREIEYEIIKQKLSEFDTIMIL